MEEMPLEFGILNKTIESVQTRVEGYNFDLRKHILEYDDVVNKQRGVIYAQRRELLSKDDLKEQMMRMVDEELADLLATHCSGADADEWDLKGLYVELRNFFPLPSGSNEHLWDRLSRDDVHEQLLQMAEKTYDSLNDALGRQVYHEAVQQEATLALLFAARDPLRRLIRERVIRLLGGPPDAALAPLPLRRLPDEVKAHVEAAFVEAVRVYRDRQIFLSAVDSLWIRHLTDLAVLREGIGLRAFGQQDPLVAYRKEAHEMYQALLGQIRTHVVRSLFLVPKDALAQPRRQRTLQAVRPGVPSESAQPRRARQPRAEPSADAAAPHGTVGRNDLCPCGSGKKYKNCHLRQDSVAQGGPVVSTRPPKTPGSRQRRRR
jgi:preprotein translocase subunit SecA